MIKAGLIGAVVGFIYMASLTLLSPFCAFCFTPLLGLGVGYLAGWFDRPPTARAGLTGGIVAGGMAGIGGFGGQILATLISAVLITNLEQLPVMMEQLGLADMFVTDTTEYWQAALSANSFCSLFNWGIIIGLAGTGGALWFQRQQVKGTIAGS